MLTLAAAIATRAWVWLRALALLACRLLTTLHSTPGFFHPSRLMQEKKKCRVHPIYSDVTLDKDMTQSQYDLRTILVRMDSSPMSFKTHHESLHLRETITSKKIHVASTPLNFMKPLYISGKQSHWLLCWRSDSGSFRVSFFPTI